MVRPRPLSSPEPSDTSSRPANTGATKSSTAPSRKPGLPHRPASAAGNQAGLDHVRVELSLNPGRGEESPLHRDRGPGEARRGCDRQHGEDPRPPATRSKTVKTGPAMLPGAA